MTDYTYISKPEALAIPEALCPMVVLSDNLESWISSRIKFWSNRRHHKKHDYSHAMMLQSPGILATQGWTFRQEPLDDWLTDGMRIKFWHCPEMTHSDRMLSLRVLERDLDAPLYRRIYDAPGVAGQWLRSVIGIGAAIQVPGIYYCSERVAKYIRPWAPGLLTRPSPADLDRYFTGNPRWQVYGVWEAGRPE